MIAIDRLLAPVISGGGKHVGTFGGPALGDGNQIVSTTQDVLLRFTEAGTTLIQGNTFSGAGVDISETSPTAGAINILGNNFAPVSPIPSA